MIETDGCIYHYTDSIGIKGIFDNNCLWATHYDYTNDLNELRIFSAFFENWISTNKPYGSNDIKYNLLNAFETMVGGSSKSIPFISSFCNDDGDTLSQWRGYGNRGDGYSIGFNFDIINQYKQYLMDKFSIDFIHITKVFYDLIDYDDDILKDISIFLKLFENYCGDRFTDFKPNIPLTANQRDKLTKAQNIYYKWFVSCKNSFFKEEQEYRIALFLPNRINFINATKQKINIEFRHSNGDLIPYIKLLEDIKPLPIKRIVIGPSINKEYRKQSMELLVKEKGLDGIKVDTSNIPFRG